MSRVIALVICFFQVLTSMVLFPTGSKAEYYQYVDKNGTVHFVDDAGKIPQEYRRKKRVYKDKYDDLSPEERLLMLERDRKEQDEQRAQEAARLAAEKQQRAERELQLEHERRLKAMTTRVSIAGNQVFVPVTLTNGSTETEAMLLLDTGATVSVITPEVASRLNIDQSEYVGVGVVGGKVLRARKTKLSQIKVGPHQKSDQDVVVIRQRASDMGDGLLGMSFLHGLKYTIDFKKQVINWLQ